MSTSCSDQLIKILKGLVTRVSNLLTVISKLKNDKDGLVQSGSSVAGSAESSEDNKVIKNVVMSKFRKTILQLSTRLDTIRLMVSKEDFEKLLNELDCSWDFESSRVTLNRGPVAQRSEQETHNLLAGGSNPSGPTIDLDNK